MGRGVNVCLLGEDLDQEGFENWSFSDIKGSEVLKDGFEELEVWCFCRNQRVWSFFSWFEAILEAAKGFCILIKKKFSI